MTFIIKGATEFAAACGKFKTGLPKTAIPEALTECADLLVSEAQGNAPVDTGELRDSISRGEPSGNKISVTVTAEHAIYVEEGTSNMSAQPYMAPAVDTVNQQVESIFGDKITTFISETFKRR